MPHEISDAEARTWSYVQAFAGFGNDPGKANTTRMHGEGGRLDVVCTPNGGAKFVRLDLAGGWEEGMSDGGMLKAVQEKLAAASSGFWQLVCTRVRLAWSWRADKDRRLHVRVGEWPSWPA
jgi:hypothetical protein